MMHQPPAPLPDPLRLPGLVNAHSHSFQRALRGRVERRSAAAGASDFWTWREAMYNDANRLTPDDVGLLARWCYADGLRAGYTAVGEFHYLHHNQGGTPYVDALALSRAIADAARAVGVRLVLLQTAYARCDFERAALPEQARFVFPDVGSFLRHAEAASAALDGGLVSSGLAIHSVRACPPDWIREIAAVARTSGVPLHIHASEQRAEVDACYRAFGCSPVTLLDRAGALGPHTTLVHATHLDDEDVRRVADSGCFVCLTPSTERNLGDGLARIADLHAAGVRLCIGTDSHARLDGARELGDVEEQERLRLARRSVLVAPGGWLHAQLLPLAHAWGAASLGLDGPVGALVLPLGLEGQAGGPDVALDAWLVGGSARDLSQVTTADGRVTRPSDPPLDAADTDALVALLTRLRS